MLAAGTKRATAKRATTTARERHTALVRQSLAAQFALELIGFYRRRISPLTPPMCRFVPSCSHYTYDAVARFGLWRGGWLGVRRVCSCHPWHPGGYDPVPELDADGEAEQAPNVGHN